MTTDKFIFKVYQNGHVERVKDCNNLTFLDVIQGLGISKTDIKCKSINQSGIYAFYGGDECDVLIFAILEQKPDKWQQVNENDVIHGIRANQFSMLSTPQARLF